jgi:regulator of protease activity HflC (stomatin/prohibitin superfamily)
MGILDILRASGRARVSIPVVGTGVKRLLAIASAAFIGLIVIYASFTVYVEPTELAVRQVFLDVPFGPDKGIQGEIYGPGLYFIMPGYERLHLFPRDMQLVEFNDYLTEASTESSSASSIRIQTSEGYQVSVDVTVSYRIVDPVALIKAVGPGRLYESQLVLPRADRYLRQTLGELNAEDFYAGKMRQAKAQQARELLTADLAVAGIQVWNVMVRHYKYDDRYQEAIEQRKIQDQTVFKNRAEAHAKASEAEKNRVLAEGAAKVEVEKERGVAEVRKINADAELYFRKTIAEGDKLVALAEAEATRLRNDALRAQGAENLVGLEMAGVLEGTQVIVVPTDGASGVNPLNLDQLIRGW